MLLLRYSATSTVSSDACDSHMWNSDLVAQHGKYHQEKININQEIKFHLVAQCGKNHQE